MYFMPLMHCCLSLTIHQIFINASNWRGLCSEQGNDVDQDQQCLSFPWAYSLGVRTVT